MKKYFLSLLLVSAIFCPASVYAATSTITAIPPRLMLSGKPGDTLTAQLKVRNGSETSQNYTIKVEDFIVSDHFGTPIPVTTSVSTRWSLASWVTTTDFVPVDPQTTQIVALQIKIPTNALPGGHYALVTFMPNAESKPGEMKKSGTLIGQRVGTLVYLTVAGPIKEKLSITRFTLPHFSESGPVEIQGTISSFSDIHLSPKASVTIFSPLNKALTALPVEVGNIFPEGGRDFTVLWTQKWGWGRYRADLEVTYGTSGTVETATVFFWLFPLRLIILIFTALVSSLTVILLLQKRSRQHEIKIY